MIILVKYVLLTSFIIHFLVVNIRIGMNRITL